MQKLVQKLILILAVLLLPIASWGATCTSTGTTWNSSDNWDCGHVPADADTVVVNTDLTVDVTTNQITLLTINNTKTLTVNTGVTLKVGADDGNIATIGLRTESTTGTGILVVNGTGKVQLKASVYQGNATWTFNAGSTIEHAGASVCYTWQIGTAASQANAYLVLAGTGTGSNRVNVANAGGAARFGGFFGGATARQGVANTATGQLVGSGKIKATYTTFTNMGDSTNNLHSIITNLATAAQYDQTYFDHCLFVGCTSIQIIYGAKSKIRFDHTSFTDPAVVISSSNYSVILGASTYTAKDADGERKIWDCAFEGAFTSTYLKDFDIRRNIFASGRYGASFVGNSSTPHVLTFLDNMIAAVTCDADGTTCDSAGTDDYPPFIDAAAGAQTQRTVAMSCNGCGGDIFRVNSGTGVQGIVDNTIEFDGFVFETEQGTGSQGDALMILSVNASAAGQTIRLMNSVYVGQTKTGVTYAPASSAFTFVTVVDLSNYVLIQVKNNTFYGTPVTNKGFFGREGGTGAVPSTPDTDIIQLTNNLLYNPSEAAGGNIVYSTVAAGWQDDTILTGNNAKWHYAASNPYLSQNTVDGDFSNTAPGDTDVTLAATVPFRDPTRNFVAWVAATHAEVTTMYAAVQKLLTKNDDTGATTLDHTAYYAWIRAGYTPVYTATSADATALSTGGAGGTYIGAMQPELPAAVTATGGTSFSRFNFDFGF